MGQGPGCGAAVGVASHPALPRDSGVCRAGGCTEQGTTPPPPEAVEGWHWLQDLRWVWGGGGEKASDEFESLEFRA